ncbi:hypothetical protein AAII07_59010 [Microvirga sp. 0TCS3.31]
MSWHVCFGCPTKLGCVRTAPAAWPRIKAVIPSSAKRTLPYPMDRTAYHRGNLIERLF